MANIGIISEFNPFHTGHRFLINSVKGDGDTVICVMSGNFVQRGDVAILPKEERVRAALKNGADLIIELPCPYSTSAAQSFATAGVHILNSLGITDCIAFGSECGDIAALEKIADILMSDELNSKIPDRLKSGETFAKIRTDLLAEYDENLAEIIKSPNNTLATEYIIAAKKLGFKGDFKTVKRQGAEHDSKEICNTAVSASLIRSRLLEGKSDEIKQFLPYIGDIANVADIKRLETAILASLRADNTRERYLALPDISEGIENRIVAAVKTAKSLDELFEAVKTKRYTLSRIRRIILCAFLGITKQAVDALPPYVRILGFNEKGLSALKEISNACRLPVITKASDLDALPPAALSLWELEAKSGDLWALSLNNPQKCGSEYFYKIVKE